MTTTFDCFSCLPHSVQPQRVAPSIAIYTFLQFFCSITLLKMDIIDEGGRWRDQDNGFNLHVITVRARLGWDGRLEEGGRKTGSIVSFCSFMDTSYGKPSTHVSKSSTLRTISPSLVYITRWMMEWRKRKKKAFTSIYVHLSEDFSFFECAWGVNFLWKSYILPYFSHGFWN